MFVLAALLLFTVAAAGYYYLQTRDLRGQAGATVGELQELISRVGRLMVLPEGEQPALATVNDPAQLAGAPFFTLAKAGDKVLIYPVAKKAILYDPTADKILEVASLRGTDAVNAAAAAEDTLPGASAGEINAR